MKYNIYKDHVEIGSFRLLQREVDELIRTLDAVIDDMAHTGAKFYHHDIEVADATLRIGCREFTVDEYRQFKEDWTEAQKEEKTYHVGQKFRSVSDAFSDCTYVLAEIELGKMVLININTGNRREDPKPVADRHAIKLSEVVNNPENFQPINEGETP